MTRCTGQGCVHWAREGALCDRCRRLTAIGHLVLVAVQSESINTSQWWNAMDAVAFLLRDYAQLKKAWRELHTEAEEGISRAARDSFSAGLLEGLDQRNRG